ncbi:antitoxin [Amycolatopsis sp. NPDC059027]|uniref:antitoxin n=1 Tax=unclassified Amycolatopsis TaxID=2618356 RepID=UPI00366CBE7A
MVNFDELKNKAQDALKEHGDKIEQGLDKAGEFAKSKFSGQADKIDGGVEKAKDFLGKFGGDKPDEQPPGGQQPPAGQ